MHKYNKGITKQHRKYSNLIRRLSFIVFLLVCDSVFASHYQYTVEFDDSLMRADIRICFDGEQDDYLEIDRFVAYKTLLEAPTVNGSDVKIEGRFWNVEALGKGACLEYDVSFKENHLKRSEGRRGLSNLDKNKIILHLEENNWLWLPEKYNSSDTIDIELILSNKYQVSTPWQQIDITKHHYRLGHEPQDWGYHIVIGDIDVNQIEIGQNRRISIATINASSTTKSSTQAINQWLENIANSIKNYLGQYPLKQMQVLVYPQPGAKRSPVPWGEISRGNGLSILFVIRPDHEISDFYEDWTASHEFAHSLLPKLRYRDIWLSEGLASYLQYVLMAQNNQLTKEQAWKRIYKGLLKGLKGTQSVSPEKLLDVSDNRKRGSRSGRTMRIYWSGAAYFLKADIRLRKQSKGKVGLNDVLLKLSNCCLKGSKVWSGGALASKLDLLSNTTIFSILYKNMAYSPEFPNFNKEFESLGFEITENSFELGKYNESSLSSSIITIQNQSQ